ncbi:MAG: hypothetical protein LUQ49_03495 [Methanomicrobiales archaeon]|nr:hypothetical protein [Methanomicrobiales archaeon]
MDRTLFRVLVVLAVASVIALAAISMTLYMEIAYRATLSGTYEYRVSITSDAALENVTLYVPIPARGAEASPVLAGIGGGNLKGVPQGWSTSLIGTEKFTLLEVTARGMQANPVGRPYVLSVNVKVQGPIDTRNAGTDDLVLVPAAKRTPVVCGSMDAQASPEARCEMYQGSAYADFTASGNAHLSIFTLITGRNSWDVFGPSSNEYQDGLQVSFPAGTRGWRTGDGILVTGIGDYGIDPWLLRRGTPETGEQGSLQPVPVRAGEGTA